MRKTVVNGVKKTEEEIKNEMLFIYLDQYDIKIEKSGKKTGLKVFNRGEKQSGKFLFEIKDISKVVSVVQSGKDFFVEYRNKTVVPHLNETSYTASDVIPGEEAKINELKDAFLHRDTTPKNEMENMKNNSHIKINRRYLVKYKDKNYTLYDSKNNNIAKLFEYKYLYTFPPLYEMRRMILFEKKSYCCENEVERFGLYDAYKNAEYYISEDTFRNVIEKDAKTIAYLYFDLNSFIKNGNCRFKKIKGMKELEERKTFDASLYEKDNVDKTHSAKEDLAIKLQKKANEKEMIKQAGIAKGTKQGRNLEKEQIKQKKVEQSKALALKIEKEEARRNLRRDFYREGCYVYDHDKYIVATSVEKSHGDKEMLVTKVYAAGYNITKEAITVYGIKPLFEIPFCQGLIQFGPNHFYVQTTGNYLGFETGLTERIYYKEMMECTAPEGSLEYNRFYNEYGSSKKERWVNVMPGCLFDPKYNFVTRPLPRKKMSVEEMCRLMDVGITIPTIPTINDMIIDNNYLLISERGVYDINNGFIDYFQKYERLLFCGEYLKDVYSEPHPILYAQLMTNNDTISYYEDNPFVEIDAITGDRLSEELPSSEVFAKYEDYKNKKENEIKKLKK